MECAFPISLPSFNTWLKAWFGKIQRKVKHWSPMYEYQNNELQLNFALTLAWLQIWWFSISWQKIPVHLKLNYGFQYKYLLIKLYRYFETVKMHFSSNYATRTLFSEVQSVSVLQFRLTRMHTHAQSYDCNQS